VGLREASFIELADPHFTQILHLCHLGAAYTAFWTCSAKCPYLFLNPILWTPLDIFSHIGHQFSHVGHRGTAFGQRPFLGP
jgi:hypothetical protein